MLYYPVHMMLFQLVKYLDTTSSLPNLEMLLSQGFPYKVSQEYVFKGVTVFRNSELDGTKFHVSPGIRLIYSLLFLQIATLSNSTPKTWMKLKRLNIEERTLSFVKFSNLCETVPVGSEGNFLC